MLGIERMESMRSAEQSFRFPLVLHFSLGRALCQMLKKQLVLTGPSGLPPRWP